MARPEDRLCPNAAPLGLLHSAPDETLSRPQSLNRLDEGTKCRGELRWPATSCLAVCA